MASIRRIIEDSDVERKREEAAPSAMAPAANDVVVDAAKGVEAFRVEFSDSSAERLPDASPAEEPQFDVAPATESVPVPERQTYPDEASPAFYEEAPPTGPAVTASVDDVDFPANAFDDLDIGPDSAETSGPRTEDVEQVSRPSLISEQTGRQVAAAFGELSEAFAASRRRSFDEMAEEMLRPMLQDWLDNNLPHLVERLVREEIERIARG